MSSLFLKDVERDLHAALDVVARSVSLSVEDLSFAGAPERGYRPMEIRDGWGDDDYRPAFLRYAEGAYALRLQKLEPAMVTALAENFRRGEERELMVLAADRAARAVEMSPLSHVVSVLAAANRRRLGSDDLVHAEREFVRRLRQGSILVEQRTGYPVAEFVSFLSSTKEFRDPVAPEDKAADEERRRAVLVQLRKDPGHWLRRLPRDMVAFGSQEAVRFSEWRELVVRQRVPPVDLVVDYCLFLVRRASQTVGEREDGQTEMLV